MTLDLRRDSIYGFSYLTERLLEKPFFLGVNELSGNPVEGSPWTFHSNPALCARNVCIRSNSLEDIVIFFLHVRRHNYNGCQLSPINFELVQDVISEIIDRIAKEIVPENSIELDTVMSAYNLITIFTDVIIQSYSILHHVKSKDRLQQNLLITNEFHSMLCAYFLKNPTQTNSALETVIASCSNFKHTLMYAMKIIEHNDLETMDTKITTHSEEIRFTKSGEICGKIDDPFFEELLNEVKINEDIVDILEYANSTVVNFTELQNEISDRTLDLHTFKSSTENSIIDSCTLDNYMKLRELCDENSYNSLNESMEKFNKISNDFSKQFWKQRLRISEQNRSILFQTEETYFIFSFTILVLEYLKTISKDLAEQEQLLCETLEDFGFILNSIRFSEINQAITQKTSAILSKTLEELVTDQSVQNFIEGTPAKITLVTTKITHHLGMVRSYKSYIFKVEGETIPSLSLSAVKPIENVNVISKIRRNKWRNTLAANTTVDIRLQFYNQDECPVCYNEQKKEHCCYFLCKHTICTSCTEGIIGNNKYLCPVCRHPICEYLPSDKLPDICQALQ